MRGTGGGVGGIRDEIEVGAVSDDDKAEGTEDVEVVEALRVGPTWR